MIQLLRRKKQLEAGDDFAAANAVSPIMQLHDRRHDRQAQAVDVRRVSAGFVGAIEALKQSGRVFGGMGSAWFGVSNILGAAAGYRGQPVAPE
jgi:hypothetical protein